MDLRWRLGVYLGQANISNEAFIGLPNGNVAKSRSIVRVVPSGRWDKKSVLDLKGTPGKLTFNREGDEVDIEAFPDPHVDGDAAEREALDTEIPDAMAADMSKICGPAGMATLDRQIRITKKDVLKYGYSPESSRCLDLEAGFH